MMNLSKLLQKNILIYKNVYENFNGFGLLIFDINKYLIARLNIYLISIKLNMIK